MGPKAVQGVDNKSGGVFMEKRAQKSSDAIKDTLQADNDRHDAMVDTEISAKDFAFFEQLRKAINAAVAKGIGNAGQNIAQLIGAA